MESKQTLPLVLSDANVRHLSTIQRAKAQFGFADWVFGPPTSEAGVYVYVLPKPPTDDADLQSVHVVKAHFPKAPGGMRYVLSTTICRANDADSLQNVSHVVGFPKGSAPPGLSAVATAAEIVAARSDPTVSQCATSGGWNNLLLLSCFTLAGNKAVPVAPGADWMLEIIVKQMTREGHRAALARPVPAVPVPIVPAPVPAAPAAPQGVPALPMAARELPADPNTPGNVWCEVCKQSLRKANGPMHLGSMKHEIALLRLERQNKA